VTPHPDCKEGGELLQDLGNEDRIFTDPWVNTLEYADGLSQLQAGRLLDECEFVSPTALGRFTPPMCW
jgi:hypothetical protein